MEHQWMFDGRASEATEARRDSFVSLLEAVVPTAIETGLSGSTILSWRIEAKMAQAELLQRSTFGRSDREKRHATVLSERLLTQCTGLLIG